jgi:hypothetical protein
MLLKNSISQLALGIRMRITKLAAFIIAVLAVSVLNMETAAARIKHRRLTFCGSTYDGLCHLGGFFDQAPFRYNLSIYPGCIKWIRIQTPYGIERRRVVVCG